MPCHFSVRDITFTPTDKGVRIVATTDIPCHLYVRLSYKRPWIHKKPSYRRGIWLNDDVRFCFTVFEDNEQYETGETITHTFWKPFWPVCITKWLYLWAKVDGVACISTSPIFKYHNDGISPIPTPDVLRVFNSIEPELLTPAGAFPIYTFNCSNIIHPESESVILHVRNRHPATPNHFNAWKYANPAADYGDFLKTSHAWAVIPLDENQCFKAYSNDISSFDVWAEGYGGRAVKGFPTLNDVTPSAPLVWETITVPGEAVGATAAIVLLNKLGNNNEFDVKHPDSTDNFWGKGRCGWTCALVGLNPSGQFKIIVENITEVKAFLLGYITGTDIKMHVNNLWIAAPPLDTWTPRNIKVLSTNPNFAVIRGTPTSGSPCHSARKSNSMRDIQDGGNAGLYGFIHCDPGYQIDIRRANILYRFSLVAETE